MIVIRQRKMMSGGEAKIMFQISSRSGYFFHLLKQMNKRRNLCSWQTKVMYCRRFLALAHHYVSCRHSKNSSLKISLHFSHQMQTCAQGEKGPQPVCKDKLWASSQGEKKKKRHRANDPNTVKDRINAWSASHADLMPQRWERRCIQS